MHVLTITLISSWHCNLELAIAITSLNKKKYSFYSCACAYILFCFDLFYLFSKGIVFISDASASTQMRSLILWLRLALPS